MREILILSVSKKPCGLFYFLFSSDTPWITSSHIAQMKGIPKGFSTHIPGVMKTSPLTTYTRTSYETLQPEQMVLLDGQNIISKQTYQ
jgi:hypothetical protein